MQATSAAEPVQTAQMADLGPAELVDVRRKTNEALARQSVPGLYAHWVLAAIVMATSSVARAHPAALAIAATWFLAIGCFRLVVARSIERMVATREGPWRRLFRVGTVISSATWGVGGALLLSAADFDRESWLVLLTLAGISAGGITSLAGDKSSLRTRPSKS